MVAAVENTYIESMTEREALLYKGALDLVIGASLFGRQGKH